MPTDIRRTAPPVSPQKHLQSAVATAQHAADPALNYSMAQLPDLLAELRTITRACGHTISSDDNAWGRVLQPQNSISMAPQELQRRCSPSLQLEAVYRCDRWQFMLMLTLLAGAVKGVQPFVQATAAGDHGPSTTMQQQQQPPTQRQPVQVKQDMHDELQQKKCSSPPTASAQHQKQTAQPAMPCSQPMSKVVENVAQRARSGPAAAAAVERAAAPIK